MFTHPYLAQAMAEDRIQQLRRSARRRPEHHSGGIDVGQIRRLLEVAGRVARPARRAGTRTPCPAC